MRVNTAAKAEEFTHEGAVAAVINTELQLRRSVMACMLWEDNFYEDGRSIADRIQDLTKKLPFDVVANIAIECRDKMKLRHVPLLLAKSIADRQAGRKMGDLLERIIQRPDEITEFLAIYWKDKKTPLAKQVKVGLARAFRKFDEYSMAKYNRKSAIKLRDVLFMCHAKPKNEQQADLWKRLVDGQLVTPDTWEVELSSGKNKKETFERLMAEKKLGALAFIRNLRNMEQAGISKSVVAEYANTINISRVLPFRFVTAARMVPQWEDVLEPMMIKCMDGQEKITGSTAILVDISGSMNTALSTKSDTTRMDAAFGVAILAREICEHVRIFTFSNDLIEVAPRRGFALRDAMKTSQPHNGTFLALALQALHNIANYSRIIIITDEQSADGIVAPEGKGYVINVANNRNGIGYGKWLHIDGWSEAVIDYIRAYEKAVVDPESTQPILLLGDGTADTEYE